jgi:D-alanyl-D-alanine carboxypeptidase
MNLPFASELGISKSSIKARGLREFEEATELELVERDEDGKEHLLVPTAAQAWRLLKAAALAEGASLFIGADRGCQISIIELIVNNRDLTPIVDIQVRVGDKTSI